MTGSIEIYDTICADGFELCHPVDAGDWEHIRVHVNGEVRSRTWRPIPVRLIRENEGERLSRSDSPWLGSHAPIFRASALDVLGDLLEPHGEFLPLSCPDARLWMFNATRVIDALDEEASSVVRFESGAIMMIDRPVFRLDRLADVHAFKIPSLRVSPVFFGGAIVRRWMESELQGLEFVKVGSGQI